VEFVDGGLSGNLGGFRMAYCHSIFSSVAGLVRTDGDTSSKDSVRLIESMSFGPLLAEEELCSLSIGKVAMKLDIEPGLLVSVSEDNETE